MSKIFNKKNINYIIVFISIIYYIYLMFFSNVTLDTGKKELENMIILAIPCFMLLFYSFNIKDKNKRKNILIVYIIFYVLAVLGFTFSNFRNNILIENGISERGFNLIPFSSIIQMLNSPLGLKVALYNIIGNFLMLTPLSILLPLVNEDLKKTRYYLIIIFIFSFCIEFTQYIKEIGSFDIDDLILNISGSLILFIIITKTRLFNYIYKLFYEIRIQNKIINIIYYLLLIILVTIFVLYTSLLYLRYQESIVNFSNLKCISNEKTFIGTLGKYNYYSECKFEGYIQKGNENIVIKDVLTRFGSKIDNYSKELRLNKEEAITNVEVKLSKGEFKLILDTDKQKYYLVDIERISYYKNGVECIIEGSFPPTEKDCSAELVTITKSDINKGYVILEGDYYNSLSCITGLYQNTTYIDYIVPKHYKLNENSCSELKNKLLNIQ